MNSSAGVKIVRRRTRPGTQEEGQPPKAKGEIQILSAGHSASNAGFHGTALCTL